jgi:hypothetical protein
MAKGVWLGVPFPMAIRDREDNDPVIHHQSR